MATRIMYIEDKSGGLNGPARIGRVTFSKTMKTLSYAGRQFQRASGGYKYNHFELETGARFWISGPRKDGNDRLCAGGEPVEIDADVRHEYWIKVRNQPDLMDRLVS